MEHQITMILLRHGATASNKEHRYLGRTEEPLSQEGAEKLLWNKEQGNYPQIDILFTSPMVRCLETAALLYPDRKPIVIPEWKEMNFGVFEGKNYLELKDDKRYQAWIDSNGTIAFPEGESREEFIHRTVQGMDKVMRQLQRIAKDSGSMPNTVGIIAHGGTIMALLSHYFGGEYFDYQVSNGAGFQCRAILSEERITTVDVKKI